MDFSPDYSLVCYQVGNYKYSEENYMEAIEKFIKSKELGYSTKEADDQLIFCYQKLNQYDKVIEIAQYYIDQGMDEYGFYSTNIAEAYSGKGNKDMEFSYYDYAVQNGISKRL